MLTLQKSLPSHLDAISRCHAACFDKSFSSRLGMAYIQKTFDWFLCGDNRFLIHVVHNDEVAGYLGAFSPVAPGDGSVSGIMQHAMKEATRSILKKPSLLFHKELLPMYPLVIKNFFRKIFKPKKKTSTKHASKFTKRLGLVVIGVSPKYRGTGVFEMLMQHFEITALEKDIKEMTLTVKKENLRAIHAYTKMGWQISKEHESTYEMNKILRR